MNQVQLHADAFGLLAIIGLVSALCTWGVVKNAGRFGLLDVPNERSSHATTTPRGGGLSIVLATFLGLLLFNSLKNPTPNQIAPVMLSGAIVALIGLFDDIGKVRSISTRLAAHVVGASIGLWIIGGVPQISVLSYEIEPSIIGNVFAILYVVWLINLYNFMDGINGLAGVEAISVCVLVSVLSARNGLTATPSPGSIFAYMVVTPKGDTFKVLLAIAVSAAVSFVVGWFLLKTDKSNNEDLDSAKARKDSLKNG